MGGAYFRSGRPRTGVFMVFWLYWYAPRLNLRHFVTCVVSRMWLQAIELSQMSPD